MINKIDGIFSTDEHDLEKTVNLVKDSAELIELIGSMSASLKNTDEGPFIQGNTMHDKALLLNGLDIVIENV